MKILTYLILLILPVYGCGFKIIKQSDLVNFHITKVETVGDTKINFDLKNQLIFRASDTSKKQIYLNIKSKKDKAIKEKNSKNEITKYQVTIELYIKIHGENKTRETMNLSEQIDYSVGSRNSQTINNEKLASKTLTDTLVNEIIKELSKRNLNDL